MRIDRSHVGKRVLVHEIGEESYSEATIKEISPAGRIKFRFKNGNVVWVDQARYVIAEILGRVKTRRRTTKR